MKNLHYHFKAHAKCKTRSGGGFQRLRMSITVSKWDEFSNHWNASDNAHAYLKDAKLLIAVNQTKHFRFSQTHLGGIDYLDLSY